MSNSKKVSIYSEVEEISIIMISDPKRANIIITKEGIVKKVSNEGVLLKNDLSKLEREIFKLLLVLGIPSNINGYCYLTEAVKIILNDENFISIDDTLYSKIAEVYDTNRINVRNGIEYVSEKIFKYGIEKFQKKINLPIDNRKTIYTNSELILNIVEYLKFSI